MTLEELAGDSGLSVGLVTSIESGASGYSDVSLSKLAKALRIEPGMILSVNPSVDPPLWLLLSQAGPAEREQIAKHASIVIGDKLKHRKP